MRKQIKS